MFRPCPETKVIKINSLCHRQVLSVAPTTDILEHIYSLPPVEQPAAMASIRAIESTAMLLQEPQPGLQELVAYLKCRGVRTSLCTRNFECVFLYLPRFPPYSPLRQIQYPLEYQDFIYCYNTLSVYIFNNEGKEQVRNMEAVHRDRKSINENL